MLTNAPSLQQLFFHFIRLGATAFGGPSMVAYIRKLAVEQQHWLDAGEFNSGAAFCQMVPGATAMQTAAYVGLRLRGVAGAAASFLGFGLPAFGLMLALSALYVGSTSLPDSPLLPSVMAAFNGMQAVIVAVIANAALSFGRSTLKHWVHVLIGAISAGLFLVNFHPLGVIAMAALLGSLFLKAPSAAPASAPPAVSAFPPVRLEKTALAGILISVALGLAGLHFFSAELFNLALLMMRIDLMAFGGGFASVPLMYREVIEVNQWMPGATFMNGIILGQATPGPIVITATFIGYLLGGVPGVVVATLSIFLPSFLIVTGVFPIFHRFSRSAVFHKIIRAVLCAFVGLLASVTYHFALQVTWDWLHALLALLKKVDILWVVLVGTGLSIAFIRP